MTYIFKYRRARQIFYRHMKVVGHIFNRDLDRLILSLPNGGLHEIAGWSKCECKLGTDWVLAVKKDMESKSGQTIAINRDLNAN